MYCDDISLDYAFAQSVLFKVYGSTVQETGHKTKGMYENQILWLVYRWNKDVSTALYALEFQEFIY